VKLGFGGRRKPLEIKIIIYRIKLQYVKHPRSERKENRATGGKKIFKDRMMGTKNDIRFKNLKCLKKTVAFN